MNIMVTIYRGSGFNYPSHIIIAEVPKNDVKEFVHKHTDTQSLRGWSICRICDGFGYSLKIPHMTENGVEG